MIDFETLADLLLPADCILPNYLAIDPEQRDQRAPEARLRNCMEAAEAKLERRGMDLRARNLLLDPMREFARGADFAEHRDPGLAIFARSGARARIVPLPEKPTEMTVLGPYAHIKPLLPLLARNRRFNILALTKSDVKLLSATPFTWAELPLEALPPEVQTELDSRPAADAAPGQHAAEEARKALLVADSARVAKAVKAALRGDSAPLILAADPHVAGNALQNAHLRQLRPRSLRINPFAISEAELHAKALELIGPHIAAEPGAVLEQINARLGTAKSNVAIRLEEILRAGAEGRLDAVVVGEDEMLPGRFDPAGELVAHGAPGPEDEDLLNTAAVLALRHGGRAFAIPRERMPRRVHAAATLRF